MMKIVRDWKEFSASIIVKSFIRYCAIAVVIIYAVVLIIYFWFQNMSLDNISQLKKQELNNVKYKTSDLFDSAGNIAYQLFYNYNCVELMTSKERDISNEIKISENLNNIMISNPFIQSIYICSNNKVLLKKDNDSSILSEDDDTILREIKSAKTFTAIPKKINYGNTNVYMIVYSMSSRNNGINDEAVMINLNADQFFKYISAEVESPERKTFIINNKGIVIADQNDKMFMQNLSSQDYIKNVINAKELSGTAKVRIGKSEYMLDYVCSDNRQFIYISLQSYQSILGDLNSMKNLVLLLCVIAFILLIVSYSFISIINFKPVRQVVRNIKSSFKSNDDGFKGKDEMQYISHTLDFLFDKVKTSDEKEKKNLNTLCNSLLQKILIKHEKLSSDELEQEFANLNINIDLKKPFAVILLRLDNYDKGQGEEFTFDLLLYAIGNIAGELLGDVSNRAFELDCESEILLINADENMMETIVARLKEAQLQIKKLLGASTTAAISDISNDPSQMLELYQQAVDYSSYRLINGCGCLFYRDNMSSRQKQNYQKELEDLLVYVKQGDRQKYMIVFNQMIEKAKNDQYSNIVNVLFKLYISMIHIPNELTMAVTPENQMDAVKFYKRISQLKGAQDLSAFFTEIYDQISDLLSSANQMVTVGMIGDILKYLNNHYSDSQLSGANIAKHFSITPQYFSKIFMEQTGESFPKYLNQLRLAKAKELLCITDKSTVEVCEMVGYTNRSYFSSLFKKEYGLSPSKFKLQYQRKNNNVGD